jgi:hypothetical protein
MRMPCTKCGAEILPETFSRTGGLCMACKKGIRENRERAKVYHQKTREYDPHRELWKSLVERVYHTDEGFTGLTTDEKFYYAVCLLEGEAYNGGMIQFFDNSSGTCYQMAVRGLETLGATSALDLLIRAKVVLFDDCEPPEDAIQRQQLMRSGDEIEAAVGSIDEEFYKDPDQLGEKLKAFAENSGLVTPFHRK